LLFQVQFFSKIKIVSSRETKARIGCDTFQGRCNWSE
jgi:hypothetical protein